MHKSILKYRKQWLAAALVILLLLTSAACSKQTTSGPETVTDRYKDGIGNYLVDASGRTLYWTTADIPSQSNIPQNTWPIFYVPQIIVPLIPTMSDPVKLLPPLTAADFTTMHRADGKQQTAYKGYPLYYYAKDKATGDTFGQGIDGVWFVVDPQVSAPMPPAVRITTPFNGDVVAPGGVRVNMDITNFTLVDKIGQTNAAGEGHINYALDASPQWVSVTASSFVINDVAAGTHTLSVKLVNNDQTGLPNSTVEKIIFVAGTRANITIPGEVEATAFQGQTLTPINQQNNNALAGTENIDLSTYTLTIDGLVDHPVTLSYADLLALPQVSQLMDLNCVEGWKFTAKWTGPTLSSVFAAAGVKAGATIAIFHTADVPEGYTSLDLSYINAQNVIIALKDNDITLPADRGFPFQVVAMGKYGYKWAKWVTRIEISANSSFMGYWELNGYSNSGNIGGP